MEIDRALIIRRKQVELSMEYAEHCAKSCDEHGLPYEFIDAVEFLPCDEAFKSVGVWKRKGYKNTMGNCCCHSSHIKCWRRIVELGKPCIILEHDAVVKGDVRNIEIKDMAVNNFGFRVAQEDDYEPIGPAYEMVRIKRSVGVHACALTPNTADWLIKDAEKNGIGYGVDRWLMMQTKSGLPLYVCDPPQVVCWARTSTSNFKKKGNNVERPARTQSQIVNYKDSLTESWIKGLKRGIRRNAR